MPATSPGRADGAHRGLEAPVDGAADGPAAQHRRRRPGRLGGHGGEHVRSWSTRSTRIATGRSELGRDDFALRPVRRELHRRGLPDDEVCIGDRYRIGERRLRGHPAPGHLLPRRDPDGRAADARPAGLPSPARASTCGCSPKGNVEAGDEIVKVAAGPERMTVAEIDALLYLPGHAQQLERRSHPGAQPGLEGLVPGAARARQARGNAGLGSSPPPAWPGFRPLTSRRQSTTRAADDLHGLADPDGAPLRRPRPGQS